MNSIKTLETTFVPKIHSRTGRRTWTRLFLTFTALASAAVGCKQAFSQTTRFYDPYVSSGGTYYWNHPNWTTYGGSRSVAPASNEWAYIYGQHGTIGFLGNTSVQGVWLGSYSDFGNYPSADATATLDLNGYTLTAADSIYVGGNRGASLRVIDGTLKTNTHLIADDNSTITVENGGRINASSGYYWSGRQGLYNQSPSRLLIRSNGIATFSAIDAYEPGGGLIEVTSGGVLNSGQASFGSNTSLNNQTLSGVLVDGSSSRWNSTGYIALYGDVTSQSYSDLTVRNGGTVSTNDQLYTSTKGRVFLQGGLIETRYVNMASGTMYHTGGTLRLTGTGASGSVAYPGRYYNGSTTLTLGGSGIPIIEFLNGAYDYNLDTVSVGTSAGEGRFFIYSGSDLTTTTGNIGQTGNSAGKGTIELSGAGSTWNNSGTIFVGNGSTTAGTLNVFTDAVLTTDTLTSSALGTVNVYGGNLNANVWNIGRSVTQTGGTIDVGRLVGTATITTSGLTKIGDSTNWSLTSSITGTGTAVKEGTGTVTTSTGTISTTNLRLDAGTLQLGSSNYIGDLTNVIMNGGTLALANGNTERIGSLSGTSNVNLNSGTLEVGNNNTGTSYAGSLMGSGNLTKIGTATLTLTGTSTYTGTTTVNSGTLALGKNDALSSATALVVNSPGTFQLNNYQQSVGSLSGTGLVQTGSSTTGSLRFGSNGSSTSFSGSIGGNGELVKQGTGTWSLAGTSDVRLGIENGAVRLMSSERLSDLRSVNLSSSGTLDLNGFNETIGSLGGSGNVTLSSGRLTLGSDQSDFSFSGEISGSAASQLIKIGSGVFTVNGQNTMTGTLDVQQGEVRLAADHGFDQSSLINVASSGTLSVNGSIQHLNLVQAQGSVSIDSSQVQIGDVTNTGSVTVGNGSQLLVTSFQNSTGGSFSVSDSTVMASWLENQTGASIHLTNASLQAQQLINNGTINGNLSLGNGQSLSGTGTINGQTTVEAGSEIAPGNSIGSMNLSSLVLGPGGMYDWEIADALGVGGSEWDFLNVSGTLQIDALDSNPFTISVTSLNGNPIQNFDPMQNYSWGIAFANGGIVGFDASKFLIDTSGFMDAYSGRFSVVQDGNMLNMQYSFSAVPEPSSMLLVAFSVLLVARRQRRTNA